MTLINQIKKPNGQKEGIFMTIVFKNKAGGVIKYNVTSVIFTEDGFMFSTHQGMSDIYPFSDFDLISVVLLPKN